MNVLSLFDGMSCGQIALERAGINVDNYFSSEIDKKPIEVTQRNYPKTTQIGDISLINCSSLPKIDLIIGGSPCQSFSKTISDNKGFNGKSRLFWEYIRILKTLNPRYFLLENVVMKKEWEDIITEAIGVEPIKINSSLFSAQTRERLYWTNIPVDMSNIKKNNTVLNDILESNVDEKYFYKEDFVFHGEDKVVAATLNINGHDILKRVNSRLHKVQTLTAVCGGNQQKKVYINGRVRKLTPKEYCRAMNIPDYYINGVSDSVAYKMVGNGWEVNTLSNIFKNLK